MGKSFEAGPAVTQRLLESASNGSGDTSAYYSLLRDLVSQTRAKNVLELGTFRGVSASSILDGLDPSGSLVSVDVRPHRIPAKVADDPRFSQVIGDSLHVGIYPETPNAVDFLFVDTEHRYGQVKAEWEIYRQCLKKGAVVCFDDIHLNEEMARFWNELDVVKWDTGRTFHPSGFGVAINLPEDQCLSLAPSTKLAVCMLVHDDTEWLEHALRSVAGFGDVYVFVNDRPWSGEPRDASVAKSISEKGGATVVCGTWLSEEDHRQKAHRHLRGLGYTHALLADSDEVFEAVLIRELKAVAESGIADRVHVEWDTYWSTPENVVRPREPFRPCVMVDLYNAYPVQLRDFSGGKGLFLDQSHGIVHHLSYCGSDTRIRNKVTGWSHKDEVNPNWWNDKWKAWQDDRFVTDLHPTHPAHYGFVEHIDLPVALSTVGITPTNIETGCESLPPKWPTISVCIPLYGGKEDIVRCLDSLESCRSLLHEVTVVDNAFPDSAKEAVRQREWVKLIENKENLGFARASNMGLAASTGDVVLFLNSDTVVTYHGLVALIEDLMGAGTIAAAGPVSNRVGHGQQIPVTYTSLESVHLFAEDLASTGRCPRDTDMLVGFCLAVKRSVLDEVGGFDEEFGIGLFEDNDLCYRIRRAGYRLVVSERAFVHHAGSVSLARSGLDTSLLLASNQTKFLAKWARDVETGFASHLSGTAAEPIVFDQSRKPETLFETLKKRAKQADVSLCMIVKDEERVIRDCLDSARQYFKEMIVVDTGSTDRTVEIAESLGARVYRHPWEDSFSVARNHSLSYATGKWIFWMDADDTLPLATGESIVNAALNSPRDVSAYVVPVQFVEEGPGSGTRVDHVKLFRNFPGLRFEGRIHEQILHSLRPHGGTVAYLGQVVLHSGYDTSDAGQAKKRTRDRHLLKLDYFENPDHPFRLFNLGMTCHYLGEHKKAVRWLRRSIAKAGQGESHLRKAYDLLGVSIRELGRPDEALATFQKGNEEVGGDPELHFHSALIESFAGNDEKALDHYDAVLAYDPTGVFHSFDIGILGFKTHHNRAAVLAKLGRYDEAKAGYLKALKENPRFLPSAMELFAHAVVRRDFEATRTCIHAVVAQLGIGRDAVELIVQEAVAARGKESVVPVLSDLARQNPGSAETRLRLARELAEVGQIADAKPILEDLKYQGFAEAAYILGVTAVMHDDYSWAREEMLEALAMNPGHEQTIAQLMAINKALGRSEVDGIVQ